MDEKTRAEVRVDEFNKMIFQLQLGILPFLKTYGDFFDCFGSMMRIKTGDYTQEDEQWVEETLYRFEKRNGVKPPKKQK